MAARSRPAGCASTCWRQVDQDLRDVDLHRAGVVAGAAERRRERQRRVVAPTPVSCGDRIAPIGPGYTEPYACPPARS